MAIISAGYDGTVTESQWSDMIKKIGSSEYGVADAQDWKVISVPASDRTIAIAPGRGWGHGVFDSSDGTVQLQLQPSSAGSRWDLIVMRRNWTGTGGSSTFTVVPGNSSRQIPPGRMKGPGVIDDQPIALVRVVNGSSSVAEIIDLRVWSGNGGMIMWHDMALGYLESLGTQIMDCGNGKRYQRILGADGNPMWSAGVEDGYVPLFGFGNSLFGGVPSVNTDAGIAKSPNFLIQAGSLVNVTDLSGYARCTFPKPFPNGLLTVITTNGDSSIDRMRSTSFTFPVSGLPWETGRKNDFVYCMQFSEGRNVPSALHRVNWIAIGW